MEVSLKIIRRVRPNEFLLSIFIRFLWALKGEEVRLVEFKSPPNETSKDFVYALIQLELNNHE